MRIAILGPAYPYRAGIAQQVSIASQKLSRNNEVINISYSMQYPKMLFRRGDQKDYTLTTLKVSDARYILNTANFLSYIKTAVAINKIRPDVLLVYWWHPYFAPAYYTILNLLHKNIKKLIFCCNVVPHERFPFSKLLSKSVIKHGDGYIVASDNESSELRKLLGDVNKRLPIARVNLPKWSLFAQTELTKIDARKILGISNDKVVLLFFGLIRQYKGLDFLLSAYERIVAKHQNVTLLIAGEPSSSERDYWNERIKFTKLTGGDIVSILEYVPNNEVHKYFIASDVVVLPYISATTSGVVATAYNYEIPVIATNVGSLAEQIVDGKTGYIIEPNSDVAIAMAIERFILAISTHFDFAKNIRSKNDLYTWNDYVNTLEKLGHGLCIK